MTEPKTPLDAAMAANTPNPFGPVPRASERADIGKTIDLLVGSNPDNVQVILEALASACHSTAMHLDDNWQDRASAKAWLRIRTKITKTEDYFNANKPY